jgi:hypothetical protein
MYLPLTVILAYLWKYVNTYPGQTVLRRFEVSLYIGNTKDRNHFSESFSPVGKTLVWLCRIFIAIKFIMSLYIHTGTSHGVFVDDIFKISHFKIIDLWLGNPYVLTD